MKSIRAAILVLGILLPSLCFSQNWINLYEDKDLKIEMDTTELKYDSGKYYLWFKTTKLTKHKREQYVRDQLLFLKNRGISSDMGKWIDYSHSIGYVVYDCAKRQTGSSSVIDFNNKNEPIERINFDDNNIIWQKVMPRSIEAQIMDVLCENISATIEEKGQLRKATIINLSILLPSFWILDKGDNGKVYSLSGKSPNEVSDLISILAIPGKSVEPTLLLETAKLLDSDNKLTYTTPKWSYVGGIKCSEVYATYRNHIVARIAVVNNGSFSYYISINSLDENLRNSIFDSISF